MASNINPSNINGAYPVAGQDNDSQGFRDNFTNIRTNFTSASTEISELQAKVVLKAALTGTTLDNNLTGVLLSYARTKGFTDTVHDLGNKTGTVTLDFANGDYQKMIVDGPITLAFTNWPVTGLYAKMRVLLSTVGIADLITFPAAVSFGLSKIPGVALQVLTPPNAGDYLLEFSTSDGGSSVTVDLIIGPTSYTEEDLVASGAASLKTTASYFTTAASETATLAAGTVGQVKTLSAVDVTAGNMVVTVTNAGWKTTGTGTVTFSARGSSCTLQYIDSKWFCIGNNGAVFG